MNVIYKGERVGVLANLKCDGTHAPNRNLIMRVIATNNRIVKEIKMQYDAATQRYAAEVPSRELEGKVKLQFAIAEPSGDIIISNEILELKICKS